MIVLIALEIYEHKFQCLKSIDSLVLLQKKEEFTRKDLSKPNNFGRLQNKIERIIENLTITQNNLNLTFYNFLKPTQWNSKNERNCHFESVEKCS